MKGTGRDSSLSSSTGYDAGASACCSAFCSSLGPELEPVVNPEPEAFDCFLEEDLFPEQGDPSA